MSTEVDHEKVSQRLSLKIADLIYQVSAYQTVVEDMQKKMDEQESELQQYRARNIDGTNDE